MRRLLLSLACVGTLLMYSDAGAATQHQKIGEWGIKFAPLIEQLGALDKKLGADLTTKTQVGLVSDAKNLSALGRKIKKQEKSPLQDLTHYATKIAYDVSREGKDLKRFTNLHTVAPLASVIKYENDSLTAAKALVNELKG